MASNDEIRAITLETQRRIGRLAKHNHGIDLTRIANESGIPYSTVKGYFGQSKNEPLHELPVSALVRLVGVIPDDLLSQLLDPADRHLARNDDDDELDDLADRADNVAREVRRARHPNSPGGTEIIAIEEAKIKRMARTLRPVRVA